MKIYRAEYYDRDEGARVSWHTNERTAQSWVASMRREEGPEQGYAGVRAYTIKPTRRDFVAFLNKVMTRDNG